MKGILYGIGVGPGDPELITLKALKYMRQSDVIILPSAPKDKCHSYLIAQGAYPEINEKEVICMPFAMTKDKKVLETSHNRIYEDIAALLEQGKTVAFLTIGDPAVYSTYSYIHSKVKERGGAAHMVSGVPSFCAAAASLGISLGDNKEEIHIIPASYDIRKTLSLEGTKVYMKSGKRLAELKKMLKESQKDSLQVYAVSNCGMEEERIAEGMENLDESSGYLTIVIVKEQPDRND
ncbi:precorrin-2 C(20)-methyltransferase [Kineothrix sp. MB12-C1]|uniref:precorrin-2 C(20)-methyltransferase n=1 Tax=Kineothrix sp. MB12-C1 TaxID=3070215 RepID=UPI0027D24934|nr:precorrin-2 C(20)-methyltransferase [Kineothrix sp. MB12-C1]WMC93291.1 precorrin-2 C(20)-methyltransferase [Kineothrix sp. MB12-C1]